MLRALIVCFGEYWGGHLTQFSHALRELGDCFLNEVMFMLPCSEGWGGISWGRVGVRVGKPWRHGEPVPCNAEVLYSVFRLPTILTHL